MEEPDSSYQVLPLNLIKIHAPDPVREGVTCALLLQVTNAGEAEDDFRVAFNSTKPIKCSFAGRDVSPCPELANLRFTWEVRAEDIDLRTNMLASSWVDLNDLVDSEEITVVDQDGQDSNEAALAALHKIREAKPADGVALRWALRSDAARTLRLQALALPAAAKQIRKKVRG